MPIRTSWPAIDDVETREFVLRADFDMLDDEGCLWVSLRFLLGPRHPGLGDTVYLIDEQQRGCVASVDQLTGWYARLRPDWSTWTGGDLPRTSSLVLAGAAT